MKRRDFIYTIILTSMAITLPLILSSFQKEFSKEDLMGTNTPKLSGKGYQLRTEAHTAFLKMKAAAALEGIQIKVVSSYRNYAHQNRIWERKYKKFTAAGHSPIETIQKIIEYSTIPGTSRHHWGTDLDIIDGAVPQPRGLLLAKNFEDDGPFCKLKEWMNTHANTYGFYLVYTDKSNRKGFKYEPWHYSYAPLSIPMLKAYRKLDLKTDLEKVKLKGSNHFTTSFIQQYITENIIDINPSLL